MEIRENTAQLDGVEECYLIFEINKSVQVSGLKGGIVLSLDK